MSDLSAEPHGDLVGWLRRRADYSGYGAAFKSAADRIEQLETALNKLDEMIVDWARDEGFPPENSACLRVVRAALNKPITPTK